jgi:Spy/CpxP family protein refolding chaperone
MKPGNVIMGTLIIGSVLLIATAIVAQQPQAPGQTPQPGMPPPDRVHPANMPNPANPDPLADVMFPPDLIMNHARELKLTDEQKAFMRGEMQRTMATFNELQWKLQDEMEVFHDTLKSSSVNEEQALAELNKVLDIERDIKRLHIGLGVRIKNHLTPDQQAELQRMRMNPMRMPPGPGGPQRPIQ